MATFRVNKSKNYTTINNTGLRDERLTWKAKGILAYILSLPDDWVFYMEEIATHSKDKLDSLKSGMKELKKYGYIKRFPIKNEKGKIVRWETIIYEIPQAENPLVEKPQMENPAVEKPQVDEPLVENPILLSTKKLSTNIQSTNEQNTNITNYEEKEHHVAQNLAIDFYMKNFGHISPFMGEEINQWIDELNQSLVVEAMKITLENNKRNWSYTKGILKDWHQQGFKTIQDVEVAQASFRRQQQSKKRTGKGYANRTEVVPDWLHQQKEAKPVQQLQQTPNESLEDNKKRLDEILNKYKNTKGE
ncbi:DnaD domain protein [Bacillus cereus]|uniref:DnaD domain protein n=1 Tax=Bacillus cereus TaxID=1396 RepID=UPI000D0E587C|nr:DnaD domain protein [Bacillus cereus]AVP48434.1 hypothetical protein C2I25_26710 [Bacillus cereus]